MVYISKPILVAALIIAPALAAPIVEEHREHEPITRTSSGEAAAQKGTSLGKARRATKAQELHLANLLQRLNARDLEMNLDARAPRITKAELKMAGKMANRIFNGLSVLSTVQAFVPKGSPNQQQGPVQKQRRSIEDLDELDGRGRIDFTALGKAATALASAATFGAMIAPIFRRPKNPTYKRDLEEEDDTTARYFDDDYEDIFSREYEEDELIAREYYDEYDLEARDPVNMMALGGILGRLSKYFIPAVVASGVGLGIASKLRSREVDGESLDRLD